MRWMVGVLASSLIACGGLLGFGAGEEERAPSVTNVTDGSSVDGEGDTTVAVGGDDDAGDDDGGAKDAADAEDAPAPGCQGDPSCIRYVFVTSTVQVGSLLGLSGADAICDARKKVNPLLAGRKFVAWISTQAKFAKDRFTATAPIRRVDGVQIATSLADLLQNGPANPIDRDESGKLVTDAEAVFTGTQNDGTVNNNCEDWSNPESPAKVGSAVKSKSANWTDDGTLNCSQKARIYCFEY